MQDDTTKGARGLDRSPGCELHFPLLALLMALVYPACGLGQEAPECGGTITGGVPVVDRIWGVSCDYTFRGEELDVVTVVVKGEAEGFDPRVWILGPEGEEEAFDDDGGGGGNSLISEFSLPRSGSYTVRVGSYENQPGAFTLTLEHVPAAEASSDPPPPPCLGGALEAGRPASHELWGKSCEFFFEATGGEVVTIRVVGETPGLDPRVWLVDPEGEEEAFDDDGGDEGDSLIRDHALLKAGTYVVRVASYEEQEGTVSVSLTVAEP